VFIQYASEVAPTEAKVRGFEKERDEQIADLKATIDSISVSCAPRILGIGLTTLAAIWLGAYLASFSASPRSRRCPMPVSQISAQNFSPGLDTEKLPGRIATDRRPARRDAGCAAQGVRRGKASRRDISHELRTPLAALMTTLEVALRKNRNMGISATSSRNVDRAGSTCISSSNACDTGTTRRRCRSVSSATVDSWRCAGVLRHHPAVGRARGLELRLNLPDPIMTQTDPRQAARRC